METRYATPTDLRQIARLMKTLGFKILNTKAKLVAYRKLQGQIILTYDEDGHAYAMLFYRVVEDLFERYIHCDVVAYDGSTHCELAAQQVRNFLRCLLHHTDCWYVRADLHNLPELDIEQLASLGFLREMQCPDCTGGVFLFADQPSHVGGVILERILAGNDKVLAEV